MEPAQRDDLLQRARDALARSDKEAARAALLEGARDDPFDAELPPLLDRLRVGVRSDETAADLAARRELAAYVQEWAQVPEFVLYTLPELGRVDAGLFPEMQQECDDVLRERSDQIVLADRVHLPMGHWHANPYGSDRDEPDVEYRDGVLSIWACSRVYSRGERSTERTLLAFYRVRGHLFHMRYERRYRVQEE